MLNAYRWIQRQQNTRKGYERSKIYDLKNEHVLLKVEQGGAYTLIEEYPGRIGRDRWRIGIPPSGPMDDLAFRIGNRLVGNEEGVAGLEMTGVGPTLVFEEKAVIALTGAEMRATLDGEPVEWWKSFKVWPNAVLNVGEQVMPNVGLRSYLSVSGGGFKVEKYLGSGASFPMGFLGGIHKDGQPLKSGDTLTCMDPKKAAQTKEGMVLPVDLRPEYTNVWDIKVLPGPQEAPSFLTSEGAKKFYETQWEISHNASRLGVRLIGPAPEFAREDGGGGGAHASNVHDNPYSVGSINCTGDYPVVLGTDGPSLGGFICPATIPSSEFWKIGQARPGDKVKFTPTRWEEAASNRAKIDGLIRSLKHGVDPSALRRASLEASRKQIEFEKSTNLDALNPIGGLLYHSEAVPGVSPSITHQLAGDGAVLVTYGDPVLSIENRVRIHLLDTWLLEQKIDGILDTVPGVRSLMVLFDHRRFPLQHLLELLKVAEQSLPNPRTQKLPTRIVQLPLAFNDRWTAEAIEKYMQQIQSKAAYLPSNVEFIAANNGLEGGIEDVRNIVFDARYLVLGLGDVYLGAPCAVPLDPRHRVVVPKYNPARTFTPEGAVGIGGAYLCIYPMESPGGYQLLGRTLPIWNTTGHLPNFSPGKPWLLDQFDQIQFFQVSENEIEAQRAAFTRGELKVQIQEQLFDVDAQCRFEDSLATEMVDIHQRQSRAALHQSKIDHNLRAQEAKALFKVQKLLDFLANNAVNYCETTPLHKDIPSSTDIPTAPVCPTFGDGFKCLLETAGKESFLSAVRTSKQLLLSDCTLGNAQDVLLSSRLRTRDILDIAKSTGVALRHCYSLEVMTSTVFNHMLRFLYESPWQRIFQLRQLIPNIPFQMSIEAHDFETFPSSFRQKFFDSAIEQGIDIFRISDSTNNIQNIVALVRASKKSGAHVTEAVLNYVESTKDSFLSFARAIIEESAPDVLGISDSYALLTPHKCSQLVGAIRESYPDIIIHFTRPDIDRIALPCLLAAHTAGANVVSVVNEALCSPLSYPSMNAVIASSSSQSCDSDLASLSDITSFWDSIRSIYAPFETSIRPINTAQFHIPSLHYSQLARTSKIHNFKWLHMKEAYSLATALLGAHSHHQAVCDLAFFIASLQLDEHSVFSTTIPPPSSVCLFLHQLQHRLLLPPLTQKYISKVLCSPIADVVSADTFDFEIFAARLRYRFPDFDFSPNDILSAALYPNSFDSFANHTIRFDSSVDIPSHQFFYPMALGEKIHFGSDIIQLCSVSPSSAQGFFDVSFSVNGKYHTVKCPSLRKTPFILSSSPELLPSIARPKADPSDLGSVVASMSGKVLSIDVQDGTVVTKGTRLATLSAMKMEFSIFAPIDGTVRSSYALQDDFVSQGDILFSISA